eukprot:CAMPEP_0198282024 /NCGR_PEP_ID=MMETSP1449-20131203/1897_1 /TAXON_ID=420275 /ORGANISM="Attheya septentrionalis, Strain CCMP2084" /LENGTH=611 /DNA_ID=CAMNT_0043978095 /DNA_START=159 /DNA_END=1991 /DNA_ORIENTATION=-
MVIVSNPQLSRRPSVVISVRGDESSSRRKSWTNKNSHTTMYLIMMVLISLTLAMECPFAQAASNHNDGSTTSSTTSHPPRPMILRIRQLDGSISRVAITDKSASATTTVSQILASASEDDEDSITVSMNSKPIDPTKTISELGLQHGSLLSLTNRNDDEDEDGTCKKQKKLMKKVSAAATTEDDPSNNSMGEQKKRFDPFPELAKGESYEMVQRKVKARSRGKMTYKDIEKIRNALHLVEPQASDPAKHVNRVYMCRVAAQRFQQLVSSPTGGKTTKKPPKLSLLLGTMATERVQSGNSKSIPRTSLSSTRADQKMCKVVKVHAIWEPPTSNSNNNPKSSSATSYNSQGLLELWKEKSEYARALELASKLGLRPVGWIYSYNDEREELPVHGRDLVTGALFQMECMKQLGREDGARVVMLALHAETGATEAFQLSDVAVQMAAEGIITLPPPPPSSSSSSSSTVSKPQKSSKPAVSRSHKKEKEESTASKNPKSSSTTPRFLETRDPILVDSKETHELDAVLCLVNTAMLSHVGLFSGSEGVAHPVKGKNRSLTQNAKKRILAAAAAAATLEHESQQVLMKELCDLNVLLALDNLLQADQTDELCRIVQKW